MARLDGLFGSDGVLRFVEMNSVPGNAFHSELLAELFDRLPIMSELRERFDMRFIRSAAVALDALRARSGELGLGEDCVLAIASGGDPDVVAVEHEVRFLVKHVGKHMRTLMTPMESFEVSDGKVKVGGETVNLLALQLPHIRWILQTQSPILGALYAGSVRLIAPVSTSVITGSKALLSLFGDPEFTASLTPDVRAVAERVLPWTRIVRKEQTTYQGKQVDLIDYVAANRERLVLKPTSSFGGRGVILGSEIDDAAWAKAVEEALSLPSVVQERVEIPRATFPYVTESGGYTLEERYWDFSPYIWNGTHASGAQVRACSEPIVSITSRGGSMLPLFVVGEKS